MKKKLTKVYCALRHTLRVACRAIRAYQDSCDHEFSSWRIQDHSPSGGVWWMRECLRCDKLEVDVYRE